jgi:hypothetical protein
MTNRTPDQQEMLDLRGKAQAWIDDLLIAGMAENAAVTAIHMALIERALVSGGVPATASWLRGMAKHVEVQGPALLKELRAQGH